MRQPKQHLGYWQGWCKGQIANIIANTRANAQKGTRIVGRPVNVPPEVILRAIDAANPFSVTDFPQYRCWLEARATAKAELEAELGPVPEVTAPPQQESLF